MSPTEVRVFTQREMAQQWVKGAVLFDNGQYQAHASRREKPGMAEVHTLDTDIFHMVEGEATVVTGGTVPDLKLTEPNEYRGSVIEGGQTYVLKKGDVIVIPAGVPHWFVSVTQPFLYFTVKVRHASA